MFTKAAYFRPIIYETVFGTIFETECLFNIFLEDSQIYYVTIIQVQIEKNNGYLKTFVHFTDLANTHKHFGGAASCFSCRAFFRRTVRKKEPTKCQGGHKNCVIDLKTRALCALCRFQKCLSVGMDPQRVMKGEELQDKKKIR